MTRAKIRQFIESQRFQVSIITLIVVNAIILGMETSQNIMGAIGAVLYAIDSVILKIFIAELALRLYAYGWGFFKRPWSLFDLFVVGIALVPATESFAALRALRVLRILRLISAVPAMRRVVEGLLNAIPGIISVASIMLIFFYVFAVIGTHLYAQDFPDWFGSLGNTTFTLFQIMTLEGWAMEIVRPVMNVHPNAWIFFILYILITTFTMLNLFIAIIVNAIQSDADDEAAQEREEMRKEIRAMERRIVKLMKESST